jgi:branched-chain amino acid transport system ATP-binding protein
MAGALDMAAGPLLRVSNLSVRFGGVVALAGVSFDVEAATIVGLIGANGAGKTTLLNCISRLSASAAPSRTWPCSRASRCSTTS